MTTRRRVGLLLACAAAGAAVGALGHWWTGDAAWWTAITVAVAAGWFAAADPTACEPPRR